MKLKGKMSKEKSTLFKKDGGHLRKTRTDASVEKMKTLDNLLILNFVIFHIASNSDSTDDKRYA